MFLINGFNFLEIAKNIKNPVSVSTEIYKKWNRVKIFSILLYKYSFNNNIYVFNLDQSDIQGCTGATVIEPISGAYDYCSMLDFYKV
ncbi:hypothetical protein H8356DRAFT_1707831 [Neocallimastix lanati (nom. inval.)]|nr:hypothetical protein H8356DRAFT_1707831 [Neocallimastix sp. JGI-2020a]